MQGVIEYQIRENPNVAQRFWVRVVSLGNHRELFRTSESYYNFADAVAVARLVANNSADAKIVNYTSVKAA